MAVYKATHCYPMLNNIDARIVATAENTKPAEYLKCKIDTSNKPITGYSIRILDSLNNQLFPYDDNSARISPVSELEGLIESEEYINTGLNGSFLHIPFFQNKDNKLYDGVSDGERVLFSYNAIYFQAKFTAHYVLTEDLITSGAWYYDATSGCLVNDGWDGIINGEHALADEVVLVLKNDATFGGLWKFKSDGSLTRYIINRGLISKPITFAEVEGNGVLITRGALHNTVYTYNGSSWVTNLNNGWVDANGNQLTWHNMGDAYKWEITLYQGEGTVSASLPQTITYNTMDYTWFDMVMQSGTILGTTNKRLQLGNTNDNSLNAQIPYGTETDPLVIQGRYAQLIDYDGKNYGSRAYIQSYDASFGFAYPQSGAFGTNDINSCNRVAFYKYSNDPNAISANDIVKYATTENIPGLYEASVSITETFTFYIEGNSSTAQQTIRFLEIDGVQPKVGDTVFYKSTSTSQRWKYRVTNIETNEFGTQATSITYEYQADFTYSRSAYYKIKQGQQYGGSIYHDDNITKQQATGLITVDGNNVVEGDLVLVKDQTNPWENGIYVVHDAGTTNTRWTRSGSYNTWGSFIGKIIYVQYGTSNGGKNFESLANTGGTLYTGGANGSGQSPLYFTEEKPIVLFAQDLYRTDIDLATNYVIDAHLMAIDGVSITSGMLIYTSQSGGADNGKIIRVTDVFPNANPAYYDYEVVETFDISTHKYLYIKNGKLFGHAVILTNHTSDPKELYSSTLYNAYLLKNTTTHTYISPYVNLKKNMALKLQDYHTVTYNNAEVSSWIKVNNLNNNTWCIAHDELASTSVLKSIDELNPAIPYKYEVRSFYRTSDENLFYCYETPYLKLSYNGEGYSDLITWKPYDVVGTDTWDEYEVLKQAGSSTYLDFMVHGASLTAIADRYVTLQGFYHQFQNLSWVSYRWVLTDSYGNILQDTGKKFDKTMEVSFYGLANDVDNNIYYAILYVEDELKQTLTFTVKLIVDPNGTMSLNLPFHATYECQTHSVVLEYDDNGQILPSINTESNIALGYINENSMYITGWDNSVVYQDEKVYITEPNRLYETPIINRYENQDELIANTSLTVKKGLEYSHFFPSNDTKVPADSHKISFDDEVLSLQTELQLNDNYCGDFLTLDLVESDNDFNYLRLVLSLDPGMSATSSALNPNRYFVRARLEAISNGALQGEVSTGFLRSSTNNFNWRTLFNNKPIATDTYQTLQPKYKIQDIQMAALEYPADFQYTKLGTSYLPWYIQNKNGDKFNTYGCTVLGNLCLISNNELNVAESSGLSGPQNTSIYCNGSLPYWVEENPRLVLVATKSPNQERDFITMTTTSDLKNVNKQSWPGGANESNYYWVEQSDSYDTGKQVFYNSLSSYPTWNAIISSTYDANTQTSRDKFFGNHGLVQVTAMPRYYGILSKQKWTININCHDLTTLYNAIIGGATIKDDHGGDDYGISFVYNTVTYCSVKITAEEVK